MTNKYSLNKSPKVMKNFKVSVQVRSWTILYMACRHIIQTVIYKICVKRSDQSMKCVPQNDLSYSTKSLLWHKNGPDGVSNLLWRLKPSIQAQTKKHQSSASLACVRVIHRWPENFSILWRHHVVWRTVLRIDVGVYINRHAFIHIHTFVMLFMINIYIVLIS